MVERGEEIKAGLIFLPDNSDMFDVVMEGSDKTGHCVMWDGSDEKGKPQTLALILTSEDALKLAFMLLKKVGG